MRASSSASPALRMEGAPARERIRTLERLLGRKTLEVEILKEALAAARAKKPLLRWPSHDPDGSR